MNGNSKRTEIIEVDTLTYTKSRLEIIHNVAANFQRDQRENLALPQSVELGDLDCFVDINQDPKKIFERTKFIAQGAFGKVYKSFHREIGIECAIKSFDGKSKEKNDEIAEEVFMMKLDHPNIPKYLGTYLSGTDIWIAMEYMDGGKLYDLIRVEPFTEDQIAFVCHQVLLGLEYIHHTNRIHRDIKSQSILLNKKGEIKIGDYRLCLDNGIITGECGTDKYMAPEVQQESIYNSKVDIWNIFIMAIEMSNVIIPTIKEKDDLNDAFPEDCSDIFRDFLTKCLQIHPYHRSSAIELLNHSFLELRCNEFIIQN